MSKRKDSRLEQISNEDKFIDEAKERSKSDLNKVEDIKQESNEVNEKVKEQVKENHWAYTIRRALGGAS